MPSREPFVFLFTGDEFFRRKKIESLLSELLPVPQGSEAASLRSTNLLRFYPDDLDWSLLLAQATTPSLMGGAQVFWISQAHRLKKGDHSAFESYCSQPARGSYFIFEAEELSGTHPLVKLAGRFGKHLHLGRPSSEDRFEVFEGKLKRFGKTLTPGARQVLEERLGASPRLMDIALDQLIIYSEGSAIDDQAVVGLTREFLRYEPFDLTEALARKDRTEALKIFHFFYEMGDDLTSVVGLIHWQLKRIWQAKKMLMGGAGSDEIARTLRIPPYRLAAFLNQAKRFDLSAVEQLLDALWQLDWSAKKGQGDEQVAMETFLAGVS